jgi:hypothetical protein
MYLENQARREDAGTCASAHLGVNTTRKDTDRGGCTLNTKRARKRCSESGRQRVTGG